ncbi:hypothetical protein DSLASN_16940 [Desulfoluna limicola]|uniref:Uncharacterized protein n=1 Tax=Desulfoluna limicola TaxID=2810562 RepID=A0ABM7PFV6_9BACT|nr:hypothetical protein [Desulfoluna limicola]BCS96062.1 hypothetical protein DSLASN_16940 [Desulfoluna limicola]
MASRFLWICCAWGTLTLMTASAALSIEPLTNHVMDGITGQATAEQADESRETAYVIPTETTPREDTLRLLLPKQSLTPSILDNDHTSAVIMDFLGVKADERLGLEAEDFHGEAEVGTITYTDEDTLTSVIFSGTFTGFFEVPSSFKDGLSEHDILVSSSRIPDQVISDSNEGISDFILSYQGATYTAKEIIGSDASFSARPNRQVQLVGQAGDKPLNILIPSGHGQDTTWHVMTTIPAGEAFVQIDVNRLFTHHTMKYTVKIANNKGGLNAGDPGSMPTDRSGTLGTLYMGGDGKTTIEPGTIVITTFDDDV